MDHNADMAIDTDAGGSKNSMCMETLKEFNCKALDLVEL